MSLSWSTSGRAETAATSVQLSSRDLPAWRRGHVRSCLACVTCEIPREDAMKILLVSSSSQRSVSVIPNGREGSRFQCPGQSPSVKTLGFIPAACPPRRDPSLALGMTERRDAGRFSCPGGAPGRMNTRDDVLVARDDVLIAGDDVLVVRDFGLLGADEKSLFVLEQPGPPRAICRRATSSRSPSSSRRTARRSTAW
jgi:hypothetical protein